MAGLSVSLPLTIDATDGYYVLNKKIEELTLQNLKHLILTCPGERMMDPNFGVGLRNYLFQQNVPITYEKISSRIIDQARQYMEYISIDDVLFSDSERMGEDSPLIEGNTLSITVKFTIVPLNISGVLLLPTS